MNLIELAETGYVPDCLIRIGIRRLLAKRIQAVTAPSVRSSHPIPGFTPHWPKLTSAS